MSAAAPKILVAVASVLACGASVAGCGPFGGDEELTTEEFLAEGDAICKQGREQYLELQREPPQSASEHAELARELVEITEGEIADIRDLNAPVDVEDDLEDYLASREAGLEIIRDGAEAAEEGDATGYAEAQARIARSQLDRAELAEAVGFSECSQPLSGGSAPR